jgi:hypothetical protein
MPLPPDLLLTLAEFDALGYACSEPDAEAESQEYGAHTFEVNGHKTAFRIARTTPEKAGQFVTLWQRAAHDGGPIRPFDSSDGIGLFVVSVRGETGFGQFVFPQAALIARDVVSQEFVGGKRAMRVYPPWSEPSSRTAQATQRWQSEHFHPIPDPAAGRPRPTWQTPQPGAAPARPQTWPVPEQQPVHPVQPTADRRRTP